MSKVWGSVSVLIVFVLGVITFVVINVFSSRPEKLSSGFVSFSITNADILYSGTDENSNVFRYTLKIETSYNQNFKNTDLKHSSNVVIDSQSNGDLFVIYNFHVVSGTAINFDFCTSNYETKSETYNTIYKTNGETQIYAESVENLLDEIELEIGDTFVITYNILPQTATVRTVGFEKSNCEYFDLSNSIIIAVSVGNGSVFVKLNGNLVKTIEINIIKNQQQEEDYVFDVSLDIEEDWIEYNPEEKTATFNLTLCPYENEYPTVSFTIYIKDRDNNTIHWFWTLDNREKILNDNSLYPTKLSITFSGAGEVSLTIFNNDLHISEIITINVTE